MVTKFYLKIICNMRITSQEYLMKERIIKKRNFQKIELKTIPMLLNKLVKILSKIPLRIW